MKYLKRINLKEIENNQTKQEIKKEYKKGTEYYKNLKEKTDN